MRTLHMLLRLLQLDLQPRELLLSFGNRLLLSLRLVRLLLEPRLHLLDLLLQPFLLPLLPLHIRLALPNLLFQRHDVRLVRLLLRVQRAAPVLQINNLIARRDELLREVVALCGQLLLLLAQLVHRVLLPERQPCPLFDESAEVCDLPLERLDRFLGALLLLVRGVDHLPCFLNLLLERCDGVLVLLRELQRSLHLGCVRDDLLVELATLLDQALLAFMRLLQGPVQLFVFYTEALQRFIAHQILQNFLEVAFERLERGAIQPHLLETIFFLCRHRR
mmetsp:Transcript_9189/g.18315  ORF Transcript_9189/g.18315 Transcript_9189/m.18315 type:complete len:277 (+) Transcript_9189:1874-2704(+)